MRTLPSLPNPLHFRNTSTSSSTTSTCFLSHAKPLAGLAPVPRLEGRSLADRQASRQAGGGWGGGQTASGSSGSGSQHGEQAAQMKMDSKKVGPRRSCSAGTPVTHRHAPAPPPRVGGRRVAAQVDPRLVLRQQLLVQGERVVQRYVAFAHQHKPVGQMAGMEQQDSAPREVQLCEAAAQQLAGSSVRCRCSLTAGSGDP